MAQTNPVASITAQQQGPQAAPYFVQQYAVPIPPYQVSVQQAQQANNEAQIIVYNIPQYVTEQMVFVKFLNIGSLRSLKLLQRSSVNQDFKLAIIEYASPQDAEKAIEEFDLKRYFPERKELPYMVVMKKRQKTDTLQLVQNSVFFKGISREEDTKEFKNYLSKYGDVHMIQYSQDMKSQTKQLLGYGTVFFTKSEGAEKMIQDAKEGKIDFKGQKIAIDKTKPKSERQKGQTTLYIKNLDQLVKDKTLGDGQLNEKSETYQKDLEKLVEDKIKKFFEGAPVKSVHAQYNSTKGKVWAFVEFDHEEAAKEGREKFKNRYDDGYAEFPQVRNINGKQDSSFQRLLLRDLKPADNLQPKIFDIISSKNLGKVIKIKVGEPDSKDDSKFKKSFYAKITFLSEQEGETFLAGHSTVKELRDLFQNGQPNVNILLSAHELTKFKQIKSKQNKTQTWQQAAISAPAQSNLQQQQFYQPQLNQLTRPLSIPFSQNYRNPVQNPGFSNSAPYRNQNQGPNRGPQNLRYLQNNRPPYQGNQNRPNTGINNRLNSGQRYQVNHPNRIQGNFIGNNNPAVLQQTIPGQDGGVQGGHVVPVQTPQVQAQRFQTLADIHNNQEDFLKADDNTKKLALGNLIFKKVVEQLKSQGQNQDQAPKITGMLIDFSVFEIRDILEMLESEAELQERITEALQLLQQNPQ